MESEVQGVLMVGGPIFYAIITGLCAVIAFLAKKLYSDQAKNSEVHIETTKLITEALNRSTSAIEANTATIQTLLNKIE